ncbi:MAG: hypothetical protein H6922_06700 [Pseudomonadaceae bacterium]|nr:hypothetical protein [Pseudomonadaceae bacterium]
MKRTVSPFHMALLAGLLLFGMFYNALLAVLNAHVFPVATLHVMLCEALVLAGIAYAAYPLRDGAMRPWLLFSGLFVFLYLWVALYNGVLGQEVSPKPLRDVFLISAYGVLGIAYAKAGLSLPRVLTAAALAVIAFLLLERFAVDIYGSIFNPLSYYINTRGFTERVASGLEGLNLFYNTQLVEGRFSLGFLSTHRLSSLFLEQTTLANFAIVLAMSLSVLWQDYTVRQRALVAACALLMLLGSDSRMALGMCAIVLLGHKLWPLLPRLGTLAVMPMLLALSAMMFYDPQTYTLLNDNLPGRFGWSLTQLAQIDLQGLLGGRPEMILESMDSGYSYVIYAQTVFGMVALWLFTALIVPQRNAPARRMAYLLNVFVAVNLMTGPTILSIKTAAPLWALAGYVAYRARQEAVA